MGTMHGIHSIQWSIRILNMKIKMNDVDSFEEDVIVENDQYAEEGSSQADK